MLRWCQVTGRGIMVPSHHNGAESPGVARLRAVPECVGWGGGVMPRLTLSVGGGVQVLTCVSEGVHHARADTFASLAA
jgi:hypothetical protein